MLSKQVKLALLLLCVPVLYQLLCPEQRSDSRLLRQLARSWEASIRAPKRRAGRVAVGVNANLDLIVSATQLLEALGLSPGQPVDHTQLTSGRDLQEQVAYSMLHCAGTERVFTSEEEFKRIIRAAYQLPREHFVGGNAALMAQKIQMTQPDTQVLLAGPIGSTLRELLHSQIHTPTFTPDSHDEIHLIMEYPKGGQWGEITSNCANRVIVSHDVSNAKMISLEGFRDSLDNFKPDLVILSGSHLMQGEEAGFKKKRLADVAQLLDGIPRSTPVHSELATIGDLAYLLDLAEGIFPRIDSLGLNEQELVSLAKSAGVDHHMPSKPGIPLAADLLHWLMQRYAAIGETDSRLTRVHFHTLAFHILATTQRPGRWTNSNSAVLAGTRIAGLQACDLERFEPTKFELRAPLDFSLSSSDPDLSGHIVHVTPEVPVASWQRGGVDYVLSPVMVCKNPLKTVGLGDAISAFGLLYSEFSEK